MVTNSFLVLVTNCLIYLGTGHKVPSIFSVNLSGSYLEKDSFKRFGWGWVLQPGWLYSGAWTETVSIWLKHLKVVSAAFLLVCFLKLVSTIFHEIFIFHQMVALQKLWNIKCSLFHLKSSFHSQDIQFLYFRLPHFFSLSAIALEVDSRKILKFMTSQLPK